MSRNPSESHVTGDQGAAKAGDSVHEGGRRHHSDGLAGQAATILSSEGGNEASQAVESRRKKSDGMTLASYSGQDLTVTGAQETGARGDGRPAPASAAAKDAAPLVIADKTAQYSDSFKPKTGDGADASPEARVESQKPPQITVSLQQFDGASNGEPHYVVKTDGTVEMRGDPIQMGSKEVRVEVEREPGAVNPTDQQLAVTNQLVAKINGDLAKAYPQEANQIVLDDQGNLVSAEVEEQNNLKPPANQTEMTPETREAIDQTKRLHNSGGVDMPRAATDGMGSFETRGVPRQQGETDTTAAMKESWAGLFKPDKDHPYETVRRHPDGQVRVGRYGFSASQMENWLNGLTPEQIDKLIAEGKLPKSFADPKFRENFKAMLQKMKEGGQPTPEEMKNFLPKEMQETMAGQILDKMNTTLGGNPGMAAAAAVSGRDAGTVDQNFINSPQAKELSEAGKSLYDIATRRQNIEGNVVGRMPEGDRAELITKALEIAGKPVTEANIKAVNLIVQHESSWNPSAHNDWDSNARKGIPSQGLMQTIPPTFNSHKDRTGQVEAAGHSNTIKDPLANLVAGINYSYSRYGSLANVPGVRSTAAGGGYRPY